jgi:hypothetical protein
MLIHVFLFFFALFASMDHGVVVALGETNACHRYAGLMLYYKFYLVRGPPCLAMCRVRLLFRFLIRLVSSFNHTMGSTDETLC